MQNSLTTISNYFNSFSNSINLLQASKLLITISFLLYYLSLSVFASELTVYTYFDTSWGTGKYLKQGFEKKCNCKINIVTFSDAGSILARLKLEAPNPRADVILGLDQNHIPDVLKLNILQKHNISTSKLNNLNNWYDKNGIFLPFDFGWLAFVYNKDIVKNVPHSFDELIKSKLKIIIQDPRSSSVGMSLLTWLVSLYGDKSNDYWQKLKEQIVTVTPGWSEAYTLFLENEADLVLSYTSSPAYHRIQENKYNFDWAKFDEGHYTQVEVMAITKTSNNLNLAISFLNYAISDEGQKIFNNNNWMFPVKNIKLPQEFTIHSLPKSLPLLDSEIISNNRSKWLKDWSNILSN